MPHILSRGDGELEHNAEQNPKGDDAQDDPEHHKVSGTAAQDLLLLGRQRGAFLAVGGGQGRFAAGGQAARRAVFAEDETAAAVVKHGRHAAELRARRPQAGHAGVERFSFVKVLT